MDKWENPALDNENLMDAHASFGEDGVSLGGKWRFFCQSADLPLPDGWEKPEFNDKKWSRISVPGSWEAQEVCPVRIGPGTPPSVHMIPGESRSDSFRNPAGLYRRSFVLSKDQGSRQIVLRFEALRACALVWVNGIYVGMTKDITAPSEFDITASVCQDKNVIAVQVLRDCGVSPSESDGMFHATGLLGDVTLYSLPARAITCLETYTRWQEDGTPVLSVSLKARDAEKFTARIALMDENRVVCYRESIISGGRAEAELPFPDAQLWCAEQPKLYRVAVILWDGIAVYHTRELSVGFRYLELNENGFSINGQPEKLFGVTYRSFDPDSGCFLSAEQMEQDLSTLRIHHLNTVMLTSPAPDALYSLCDRLGVYVLDRTAAVSAYPLRESRDEMRNLRSARTFGFHPCVLFGNCCLEASDVLPMSRIAVTVLPDPEQLPGMLGLEPETESDIARKRKSAKTAEAAQSNAGAVLYSLHGIPDNPERIIRTIRDSDHLVGAVFGPLRTERFLQHTHLHSPEGFLMPDGTAGARLRELRVLLQPIAFCFDSNTVTVTNLSRFRSTDGYRFRYFLSRDGESVADREMEVSVAPGETKALYLDTQYDIFKSGRYYLNAGFVHPETGASVASAQWEAAHLRHIFDENPGGTIREDQGSLLLRSGESSFILNRTYGALEQIMLGDRPVLTGPMRFLFVSSGEKTGAFLPDEWEKMTFSRKRQKPSVLEVDHMTRTVSASYKLGSGLIQNCRLYSDGSMAFELRLRTGRTAPAQMGVSLPVDPKLCLLRWFGMGPDDAAPGHQAGRFIAVHTQNGASSSGSGMKDPVYHLTLTDGYGFGLAIRSEKGLRASFLQEGQESLLRLVLCESGLKPHTTYTFPFIIQPVQA